MTTKIIKAGTLTRANGEEIQISDSEQETFRPNNTTTITCDGPRCAARHDTTGPLVIVIVDEDVRKNSDAVPDEFARFAKMQPYALEDKIVEFCGKQCLIDFMNYDYVAPLSPREKAAQTKNNEAVDASRFNHESVSQADGLSEDDSLAYIGGGN